MVGFPAASQGMEKEMGGLEGPHASSRVLMPVLWATTDDRVLSPLNCIEISSRVQRRLRGRGKLRSNHCGASSFSQAFSEGEERQRHAKTMMISVATRMEVVTFEQLSSCPIW